MENENQKQAKAANREQLKKMQTDIKIAFKAGNFDDVKMHAEKIKALDPKNHLADKLVQKANVLKKKKEAKEKAVKVKEYLTMLKKLYKEKDSVRLRELVIEMKEFDPENKTVDKWMKIADKLDGKSAHSKKSDDKQPVKFKAVTEEKKDQSVTTDVPPVLDTPSVDQLPAEKPVPVAPAVIITAPAKPANTVKENTFTKMFGGSDKAGKDKKSIIDNIVAKTDKKEEDSKKHAEKKVTAAFTKIKKEKKPVNLLAFSKTFMNLSAVFIVLSGAFLYMEFLDTENNLLGFVGVESNTGSRLYNASEEIREKKREEAILNSEIVLYKGGYNDSALSTVATLIEERIDWPDIFAKINEVTNSVYELNDFFKYIEYNNYSFDAENKAIRVTGTLSDPLGRNLTRLVELEEAFKYYPQDKDNPDDPTQPYFTGFREFTSFSKSLDQETGRYNSNFQLSFALNK